MKVAQWYGIVAVSQLLGLGAAGSLADIEHVILFMQGKSHQENKL